MTSSLFEFYVKINIFYHNNFLSCTLLLKEEQDHGLITSLQYIFWNFLLRLWMVHGHRQLWMDVTNEWRMPPCIDIFNERLTFTEVFGYIESGSLTHRVVYGHLYWVTQWIKQTSTNIFECTYTDINMQMFFFGDSLTLRLIVCINPNLPVVTSGTAEVDLLASLDEFLFRQHVSSSFRNDIRTSMEKFLTSSSRQNSRTLSQTLWWPLRTHCRITRLCGATCGPVEKR